MTEKKPIWKSKTKLGGVIGGVGAILTAVGGYLTGEMDAMTAWTLALGGVSAVLLAIGIRDALTDLE